MSLFAASTWFAVASFAYSYANQMAAKRAAKKAKAEAERRADLAKGLQIPEEGQAAPLGVPYGRVKLGGVRVHFKVSANYYYPGSTGVLAFESKHRSASSDRAIWKVTNTDGAWTGTWNYELSNIDDFNSTPGWIVTGDAVTEWKLPGRTYSGSAVTWADPGGDFVYCPFKGGSDVLTKPPVSMLAMGFAFPVQDRTEETLVTNITGTKNEFYFVQQAISVGGLTQVYSIDIDRKPYTYDPFAYGFRAHIHLSGGTADALMTANDATRSQARFTNVAYATLAFRLNRDDPQYSGTPSVQFYSEGVGVHYIIDGGDGTYSLSSSKAYSNNPPLVLLDYLTNTAYGKGISLDDIDLKSFYKASRICDMTVLPNVERRGTLWVNKGATRNIKLFECNISLSTANTFRDNIQKILNSMGLATLVWSEGKYRLNLAYALLYDDTANYLAGDVVQRTISGKNRLYRALVDNTNKLPEDEPTKWAEDVIPDELKNINDDVILRTEDVIVSWPSADTKLNFATVRFLNEEQDFAEDTISWPDKEPTSPGDTVYETFLAEDNGIPLETEFFEDGCTTPYHAKAKAEQRVRASRDTLVYTFSVLPTCFALEPGDIFGFESDTFNIPYTILVVNEVSAETGGIVKVTASTFDAKMLAWNVPDGEYSSLSNAFETNTLGQAKNLRVSVGDTASRVSNYVLSWEPPNDSRVKRYAILYTSDSLSSVDANTVWTEAGTTSSFSFELPPLDGTFTLAVVAMTLSGRRAPYRNLGAGSFWPMVNLVLSSAFLDGFSSINVVLSNDQHSFIADTEGVIDPANYIGSGTDIVVFSSSTALVYDGVGTTNGTWKVVVHAVDEVNISAGTIAAHPTDETIARIGDASGMTAATGEITFTVTGKTVSGTTFTVTKKQTFSRLNTASGADARYFYIDSTAPVITKTSHSASVNGVYSSVTVKGKKVIGDTVSDFGYVTATTNLGAEVSTAVSSITTAYTSTSGISSVTVRMYDTPTKTTLLDTEVIPVVFKGDPGTGAVSAYLSNTTHAVPAESDGAVTSYSNSGTAIYVYEGGSRLVYDGEGSSNGTWSFSMSGSNITVSSSITDSGDFATVGDHSAMVAETAAVNYTIYGKTANGTAFELPVTQTFLKARRGATAITSKLTNPNFTFATDSEGTITSYTGTGTNIQVYEGATKLTYNGVGTTAGKWKVTATGVNITPNATISLASATDAAIGIASAMTGDNATITYSITGRTSTGVPFSLTETQTFVKQKQGITGTKNAIVYLYQWATTRPTDPTGTSTLQWSPVTNTAYTKNPSAATDYWDETVPSNPGTPGLQLWTATKTVTASNGATETSVDWTTGVEVSAMTANGMAGVNTGYAVMYKWSLTIPEAPVGTNTFTWATNSMNAVTSTNYANGWRASFDNPQTGYTLYSARVRLSDSVLNETTLVDWTLATLHAETYAGLDGDRGTFAPAYRTAFAKSAVPTATPASPAITSSGAASFPPDNSWGLSGSVWSAGTPELSAGDYLWKADALYDPETGITTWSTPYWATLRIGNLSAISANMGTLTSGKIMNSDGSFIIDLDNKFISITV